MLEPDNFVRETPLPLRFFMRRYGLSRTTLWRWRRAGLPALRVAGQVFIRESDFLDFLSRMNRARLTSKAVRDVLV